MTETSISVQIAGRAYPIKVRIGEADEVRKAAEMISAKVKELQNHYAVRDKQDLLAMCALQLAAKQLELENNEEQANVTAINGINELDSLVSEVLKKLHA